MQIEPLAAMPPKMERPASTGAVAATTLESKLLSNDSEVPVQPVQESQKPASASTSRGQTVWLESERRAVFRLLNEDTGEIVSQIPSEEVLRVARNIEAMAQDDTTKELDLET